MSKAMLLRTPTGLRGATPDDQAMYAKFKRRLETMAPGKTCIQAQTQQLKWTSPQSVGSAMQALSNQPV